MTNTVSFNVLYDRDSDVLYLSSRHEPAIKGKTDSYGIVWRYAGDGALIGATILDYRDYWSSHLALLETQLAEKFDVPVSVMKVTLERATS